MANKASPQARKRATTTYFEKALARISLVISHTEPEVLDALNKIMAKKDCSKASAIKTALVEYAKILD